jgi:hypothetical protein
MGKDILYNKILVKNKLVNKMITLIQKYPYNNNYIKIIDTYKTEDNFILFKWDIIKKYPDDVLLWYFNFRKFFVDKLIELLFNEYNCSNTCIKRTSGSDGTDANLKSDYDLIITNPNYYTSTIINIFNSVINNIFGDCSAIVFDTNVYGYSGLIPITLDININKNIWEKDVINGKYYLLNTNNREIINDQLNWALLKLETYGFNLNNQNLNIWKYNNNIININNKTPNELNNYYINRMIILEDSLKKKVNNTKEIINNISFMDYYGNETYFTYGAFKHVVGTMFFYRDFFKDIYNDKPSINLNYINFISREELLNSMIENFSYYYHNKNIITGVKYLERFFHGYILILLFSNNNLSKDNNNLLILLNYYKKNVRNVSKNIKISFLNNKKDFLKNINNEIYNKLYVNPSDNNFIELLIICFCNSFNLNQPTNINNYNKFILMQLINLINEQSYILYKKKLIFFN